ncbi:MAG: DUF362 domain-containing protein [Verrucomicrobia bacterium]|nr:DUF362 domain-containing protein [Verrucomicrobiota bacterium]
MKMTRRDFLKHSTTLAAAGFLGPKRLMASPNRAHRIVRVHHPLASYFDVVNFDFRQNVPDTYYGNFVNGQLVDRMFDAALCGLTGDDDPVQAMRRLVPYQPGERVFIKINVTTCFKLWPGQWDRIDWDLHYNDTDAIAEPINATIRALVRIGVPQEMIGIGDPTWTEGRADPERRQPRLMPNRLAKKIKAAFPSVVLYRSSFIPGGDGFTWKSNDKDAIVEFRDPVINARKARATSHRLPDQVIGAQHMINLPIMKTHNMGGVTGALKNNFGTVASCSGFHERRKEDKASVNALLSSDANAAVDIWLNPHVGAKTRLIVCDGIFGGWDWGEDPPIGWEQFGGRSPNCLVLGTDPIAMDSVIYDQVTASLSEKVKNFAPPNMLVDGAKVGLGCHESRPGARGEYKTIDYVELNQAVDEAKLQKLSELKKRYHEGEKAAAQIKDLLAECSAAL